jgi:hypothetical protein
MLCHFSRIIAPRSRAALLVTLVASAPAVTAARNHSGSEVVVANGPHAGSYPLPGGITCLVDSKRHQMSMSYTRDAGNDPKALTEAVINIYDMNAATPGKNGQGAVIFGPSENKQLSTTYELFVPTKTPQGSITFATKGKGYAAAFDGMTEKGIKLHIGLECPDAMTL